MARLNKADEDAIAEFGFAFEEPPDVASTRRSRYDDMWDAARNLCVKNPSKSLKVRSYNNASTAYNDAKAINNGEHRMFVPDPETGESASAWLAVAVKNAEVLNEKNEPTYDLYLKHNA